MHPSHSVIDWDDWIETFEPSMEGDQPRRYETFGADLEIIEQALLDEPGCVWTEVDTDPWPTIVNGMHHVNRLSYYLTEKAAKPGADITVVDAGDEGWLPCVPAVALLAVDPGAAE